MLAGAGALAALMPQQALAQFLISGGAHEIVDGDGIGAGTPPATQISVWNTGNLYIGFLSNGTLTVRNGGRVGSATGWLGFDFGDAGNVTVTGADSEWINSGDLFVGYFGNGTLTISDGGRVENTTGRIGFEFGATGDVTVTGDGSEWVNSDVLTVGDDDNGTLIISDGGRVSTTSLTIGANAAGTGTLSFGAAAGDAAVAAGTLDTPTIAFGPGTGTIVFNHTDNDFELDADISGAGTIRLLSGRTILSGNSSYTGDTLLEVGTLTLASDNALGSSTLRTTGSVVDYADGVDISNAIVIDSNTTQFQVLTGSATQSGVISENNGPRPFEKIGDGELVLTAANTWTGDTTITGGTLTFDGGSVSLAANRYFYIGRQNGDDSTLNILNGGSVSSQFAYIGDDAGSAGLVTVSGAGSLMMNSAETTVGRSGTGTLNIEDGGEVSSTRSWIGRFAGSNGTASVTGTDSLWTHSVYLVVGTAGDGDLTISDGGSVEVADQGVWIGEMAGSIGAITVTGADSSLVNTGTALRVGNAGFGTLTISDDAGVTNTDGYIGVGAGSTGEVTVTGANSSWTNSNHVYVGYSGDGTLNIENGGHVSGVEGWIGRFAGSSGIVTVTGADSRWTSSSRIYPGIEGDGTLIIADGGEVVSAGGTLGFFAAGTGNTTVTGPDSRWTNTDGLTVGANGTGILTIADGGSVSNTVGVIGSGATSNGSAIVTGADSIWINSSELRVGSSGDGTLTIADGGVVNSNGGLVGADAGSSGTATVTGANSTWNTGSLRVGRFGDGTLTISNGGTLTSVNAIVAAQAGSSGSVTVTGSGSSWTSTNYLDVGDFDTGYLTIADGGTVTSATGRLGYYSDGDGHVTVTGADSSWSMTGLLSVGRIGAGALTIADGGEVSNAIGYIGEQAGSTGAAAVTGAGSSWINSDLYIGNSGEGTLTLSDDGEVSADEVIIANNAGSTGTVYIGSDGVAPSGAGILNTPSVTFGAGTGALVFNHTNCCGLFFDADISSDPLGQAFILHAEGLTHLTGNSAGFAGDVIVGGGALSVDGTLGSGDVALGVDGSGFLTGSGTIGGDVLVSGGTLLGTSGATLTITGDLELDAGSFVIAALGAPGDGELFAVGGDLTLDGTLDVIDMGGFGPGLYGLFTYGGSLTDNGLALGSAPVADLLPGELTIQTSVAGEVNLVSNIGVDLLFWDGDDPANALNGLIDGGDGVWSANSFTFTDADGLVSGPSRPTPGFIVFSAAAGNVTVDDSDGEIEIAGAQFAVDGYVIDGDGITLAGNGDGDAIFRVGNGTGAGAAFTATIGSDLVGDAALVKTDLGTLILTGHNSYTGGTEVRSGTLIGSTASIMGDIANDGVVVFDQAGDAALDQALSGNGLVRFTGGAEFTLGSGNSYAGGTQVFGSQLVLTAGDSAGTGAITLNNSNTAYGDGITVSNTLTFSGTNELQVRSGTATHAGHVTGGGDLGLTGAGTLIFTGNGSAFTGNTIITGNVLMNGTLGGTIEVADGGMLRGFGTLGSTTALAGSTIAPGNSVGTLTIDGDLVFEDGSLYEVTVAADGSADLIAVSGAATISPGAVITVGSASGISVGAPTVVLSAAGGVTGSFQFGDMITGLPFITSAVETDGDDVTLFFGRNETPFASFAAGGNAASVAQAADTLGSGNPLWQALVWLDAASAPLAFEALNGEIHATHRQLVLDETIHTRRAVTSRLAAARSEETGSAWISGHFGGAQLGSRDGASRVSADTSGVMLGLDTPVNGDVRIGVMAAFGETAFNITGRSAAGLAESRSLGVYGGGQFGGFGLSAGAIYGWHDLSTNRLVSFPGINEHINSSHSADSVQVFGEASLAGPAGFEPFLSLAHVRLDTGRFAEAGGVSALALDGETRQMTQGRLGSRFAHDWQAGDTALRFEGSLGWRRVFSGHRQFVSGNLAGAPVFFEGNGVDRDAAAIEAGMVIEPLGGISLELGYAGEIGSNARNHGAEFRARWAF
ncbi:autotransporter domain-containing protein [Glycocaulis abyssi]